jgi:hypothetical protein
VETDSTCGYRYSCNVYGPNPSRPKKCMVIRQASGLLRIDNATGEIQMLEPMPGDHQNGVALRAAGKVHRHWTRGEYPEVTLYACGGRVGLVGGRKACERGSMYERHEGARTIGGGG